MSHMPPPLVPEHDPHDPRDSVPPLSASETGRLRAYRPRRRGPLAPLAIVFAVGLTGGAAVSARSLRFPSPAPASDADAPDRPDLPDAPLLPAPVLDGYDDAEPPTLDAQRARLFQRMRDELAVTDGQMRDVEAIFAASPVLGQGNPAVAKHPMKRSECRRIRVEAGLDSARDPACAAPNMVPLYDPEAGRDGGRRAGLHRPVRVPGHPLRVPGRARPRARGRAALRARSASASATPTSGRAPAPAPCARPRSSTRWGRPRLYAT